MVARHRPRTLRIVARFGDVVIREPEVLFLESIPDAAPVVTLEGAPRQVLLVEQSEDIPVRYEATDDHGLREVHLVLRSGVREERRVLARLDGETKSDKGGQVLKLRDPFVRKSHAPVEVTVEAKDNDPLTGPKWGASPAITLIPPDVGEPEARRLGALRKLRDALVDSLAWLIQNEVPAKAADRKDFASAEKARTSDDERLMQATLAEIYAGVKIPARLRAILLAQQQKTRKAVDAEAASPSAATHGKVVKATERFVLVVDAVIRGLGLRDTRDSARQLADVADDLALGLSQMHDNADRDERTRGGARADAATLVLTGGGHMMLRLGALGRDLGEIVDADLARVKRGRAGTRTSSTPSWRRGISPRACTSRIRRSAREAGSEGRGRVGRSGRGTPGEEGEDSGDEVDQAQQEAAQDLERLAQEHAGEIGKIEQALAEATSDDELKELRDESKRHAEAVREAVKELAECGVGQRFVDEQRGRSARARGADGAIAGRNASQRCRAERA